MYYFPFGVVHVLYCLFCGSQICEINRGKIKMPPVIIFWNVELLQFSCACRCMESGSGFPLAFVLLQITDK